MRLSHTNKFEDSDESFFVTHEMCMGKLCEERTLERLWHRWESDKFVPVLN
jgi:hypothetical protein